MNGSPLPSWPSFLKVRSGLIRPLAPASAVLAGIAGTALTGMATHFLTGSALAGLGGAVALAAYNYLLPSATIRAMAILRTISRYGDRYFGHHSVLEAMADYRTRLFGQLTVSGADAACRAVDPDLPPESRRLAARLVQDTASLETRAITDFSLWAFGGSFLAATLFAFMHHPLSALILLGGLGLTGLGGRALIHRLNARRLRQNATETEARIALQAHWDQARAILPDIRVYGLAPRLTEALECAEADWDTARRTQIQDSLDLDALTAGGLALSLVGLLLHGGAGALPALAGAVFVTPLAFEALTAVLKRHLSDPETQAAAHRIDALGQRVPAPLPPTRVDSESAPLCTLPLRSAQDFSILRGMRLHLRGISGSGKTQAVTALMARYPAALFSYQPQSAPVLTGTVRENLDPAGRGLSEVDLWAALEGADLAGRIRTLPDGLNTWLGDGGLQLSGGEKKRLSLARALLRPAPLLILDEPTEGLDPATESRVVTTLAAWLTRTGQGIILISHRPLPHDLCTVALDVVDLAPQYTENLDHPADLDSIETL